MILRESHIVHTGLGPLSVRPIQSIVILLSSTGHSLLNFQDILIKWLPAQLSAFPLSNKATKLEDS